MGETVANEFREWCSIYNKIPRIKDIANGEFSGVPNRPEALFAISSGLSAYIRKNSKKEEVNNIIAYASNLPLEFKNKFFTDLLKIKKLHKILQSNYIYCDWFDRSGRFWDDYD